MSVVIDRLTTEAEYEGQTYSASTDEVLKELLPIRGEHAPDILPSNTVFRIQNGRKSLYVHETAPAVHLLQWSRGTPLKSAELGPEDDTKQHPVVIEDEQRAAYGQGYLRRQIALPYVYLLTFMESGVYGMMHAYFRNEPLQTIDDLLYAATLPNVYPPNIASASSKVCDGYLANTVTQDERGHSRFPANFKTLPATERERLIARQAPYAFFGSAFNYSHDYSVSRSWYTRFIAQNPDFRVDRWEQRTIEDPSFVLKTQWPGGITLREILNTRMPRLRWNLDEVRRFVFSPWI